MTASSLAFVLTIFSGSSFHTQHHCPYLFYIINIQLDTLITKNLRVHVDCPRKISSNVQSLMGLAQHLAHIIWGQYEFSFNVWNTQMKMMTRVACQT